MRYLVSMTGGQTIHVEAANVVVSEHGTLTFRDSRANIVAAFPPTGWVRLRRENP